MIKKKCKICEEIFVVKDSKINVAKCCSKKCLGKWLHKTRTGISLVEKIKSFVVINVKLNINLLIQ